MTIKEAKLVGLIMKATETHKGSRLGRRVGQIVSCECDPCKFVRFIWMHFGDLDKVEI